MGTYLYIKTRDRRDRAANQANSLWLEEYPVEKAEGKFRENFYGDEQGPTLHFYTRKDFRVDSLWWKNSGRTELGFVPGMSDRAAMRQYRKVFPEWSTIGRTEIKLDGGHYCVHKLMRVKAFLDKYSGLFEIDGDDDLVRFIGYRQVITTSAYCGRCNMEAQKLGITLPVNAGQNGKMCHSGFTDATGKDVTEICDRLVSYSFSSEFYESLQ